MKMFKRNTLRFEFMPILLGIASFAVFAAIVGITIFIIKKIKEKDENAKAEEERKKALAEQTPIYPPVEEATQEETKQNKIEQAGNNQNNLNNSQQGNTNNTSNGGNNLNTNANNNNDNNSINTTNNNLDNLYNKNVSPINTDVPNLNLKNNNNKQQGPII